MNATDHHTMTYQGLDVTAFDLDRLAAQRGPGWEVLAALSEAVQRERWVSTLLELVSYGEDRLEVLEEAIDAASSCIDSLDHELGFARWNVAKGIRAYRSGEPNAGRAMVERLRRAGYRLGDIRKETNEAWEALRAADVHL